MDVSEVGGVRSLWRRSTRLDRVALGVVFFYGVFWLARAYGAIRARPGFLGFLAFLSLGYLVVRFGAWLRRHGLWSLRNRLVVAYIFIAVVPVVLLVAMAGLSAYLIYSQLGAHLLSADLRKDAEKLSALADAVLGVRASEEGRAAAQAGSSSVSASIASLLEASQANLPGLRVEWEGGEGILKRSGSGGDRFAGIVQSGNNIWLKAVAARQARQGRAVVQLSVPVTEELLERLAPELGPIQLMVTRPAEGPGPGARVLNVENRRYFAIGQITSRHRVLPPPRHWLDVEITGFSTLEAVWLEGTGESKSVNPVLVSFSARPSQLNRLLFASLGTFGDLATVSLFIMGIIFLLLELGALRAGVHLTRHITQAVDELYAGTQRVQHGDFTHRMRIQQKDQLGALGEAFNAMAGSVAELIEEQRQRQRLENELSIAREVQAQLFPRSLPQSPGVELAAVCRPARVVSGDYYDFIPLGQSQLALAIADISGKGISAALLMASLQAALRSQVLLDGNSSHNTAELVSRLNLHLFLNSSADRYATFFYAVYDASRRVLRYTNAGHLPPFYVVGERVRKLEEGGMVVGLFDDCTYEQGEIQIEAGGLLVAYSDGLIELENVYGEEFGREGLLRELLRHRNDPVQQLAEALVQAAEEWAGTPEQADDMTVIVARMA